MQEKVLADLVSWRERGRLPVPVAIAAAPVEFLRGDYADRLLRRVAAAGVPASLLQVEVGESGLIGRGAEVTSTALRTLRQAGVRIVLGAFGAGLSSLAGLEHYPVDVLKIDPDFVSRMGREASAVAIVQAVAQLGPLLRLEVVGTGVTTEWQRDELQRLGCAAAEGRLMGTDRSAVQVTAVLDRATDGSPARP
jgi:EAL domain-containing protein (putative c-di-GMP-specific phosphodiesterase class I)